MAMVTANDILGSAHGRQEQPVDKVHTLCTWINSAGISNPARAVSAHLSTSLKRPTCVQPPSESIWEGHLLQRHSS